MTTMPFWLSQIFLLCSIAAVVLNGHAIVINHLYGLHSRLIVLAWIGLGCGLVSLPINAAAVWSQIR